MRIAELIFAVLATAGKALLAWNELILEARLYGNPGRKRLGINAKIIVPAISWNLSMTTVM